MQYRDVPNSGASARRLIVNADGFGFTTGINRGIWEATRHGIVTSLSCNTNFPGIADLPSFVREFPHISIGVHLNPIVGHPVSDPATVSSLVRADGRFWAGDFTRRLLCGNIRSDELARELAAQIAVVQRMGVTVTHWDSHQNKHLYPRYFTIALEVAGSVGIRCMRTHDRQLLEGGSRARHGRLLRYYLGHPRRLATHALARVQMQRARRAGFLMADRLLTPGYLDGSHKTMESTWLRLVKHLPVGTSEVYCHPGYADEALRQHAYYVDERRAEIEVLCSHRLRAAVERHGVELVSFAHLIA